MDLGWLSGISTDLLSTLNDFFKMSGWILAALAALALASEWTTGRELDRRRVADAARLRQQVQSSEKAAARAQEEARALQRRLAPRDVTAQQRAKMVQILKTSVGGITIIPPADPEADIFARRLEEIFSEAGWAPERVGGMSFGVVREFVITVRDLQNPPARVTALRLAIEEGLGQPVKMSEQRSESEDHVRLSVPHRPADAS